MVKQNQEDAEKRMQGKRTAKRKNKRSSFKHRPDKTMTKKRNALSNSKTE